MQMLPPCLTTDDDRAMQVVFVLFAVPAMWFAANAMPTWVSPRLVAGGAFVAATCIAFFFVPTIEHAFATGLAFELIACCALSSWPLFARIAITLLSAIVLVRFAYRVPKIDSS